MELNREKAIQRLKTDRFDVLVIGGGATGLGTALDAASRGLQTALVERFDYAEGTSGRSTKLIHGGVRYLEKAVKNVDMAQYRLVREGLAERRTLLANAPHLVHPIEFVTPIYRASKLPYVWAGLKLYDLMAGSGSLGSSRLLGPGKALSAFPGISRDNLKGGVLYRDGQFSDCRMAVALAQTAASLGAACANHAEVVAFAKKGGKIIETIVRDALTGEEFAVRSNCVINASGPYADRVRKLDDPDAETLVTFSTGIHIALDKRFAPPSTGLLIPQTEDGRVLFLIPWEGGVIAGSTDDRAELSDHPSATEGEIGYLLRHLACHLEKPPGRGDVLSAWSGIRPLVAPDKGSTHEIVREHRIIHSPSGLITVAGGKWTSYRRMAAHAIDAASERFKLPAGNPSATQSLVLVGSGETGVRTAPDVALPEDVAARLTRAYGKLAHGVAALAGEGFAGRLHPSHPYIEAEAVYACRVESARKPLDVLARRTPLAVLDSAAARAALPRVTRILAQELGWDEKKAASEEEEALRNLASSF